MFSQDIELIVIPVTASIIIPVTAKHQKFIIGRCETMQYLNKINNISETDLLLIENHEQTIKKIEYEKKRELLIFFENEIRKTNNLINDFEFLENYYNNYSCYELKEKILYCFVLLNEHEYIKLTQVLTEILNNNSLFYIKNDVLKVFNTIKKDYLNKLEKYNKI